MKIGPLSAGAGTGVESAAAAALGTAAAVAKLGKGASIAAGVGRAGALLDGLMHLDPAAARRGELLGGLLSRFARGAVGAGGASHGSRTGRIEPHTARGGAGSLAFLRDPRLSVEEKLARLMIHLSDKYEKQLEQKLQQYSNLENGGEAGGASSARRGGGAGSGTSHASNAGSGARAGLGGPFGFGGGAASSPFPGLQGLQGLFSQLGLGDLLSNDAISGLLGQVAGPVLAAGATAFGMPQLAPMLMQAGPLVGGLASGALSSFGGFGGFGGAAGQASGAGSAGRSGRGHASGSATRSASGSGRSSSGASGPSEKQLMTEIQILQEKQKEMFGLVSGILRSMHDTKMAVISNLR